MHTIYILKEALVSSSDMIKNYKNCRKKADKFDKIYILKNNQLDAVLFSIAGYEKISILIEHIQDFAEEDIRKFVEFLPKAVKE